LSQGNIDLPPPEKNVKERELQASDSYTHELPTFTPRVDDIKTSNDMNTLIEDQP